MNKGKVIAQVNEIFRSPEPQRKNEFLRSLGERGLAYRRPVVMSHGEFLLRQLFYMDKRIWVLSAVILLLIACICCGAPEKSPFALTPLLAAGILLETRRSFRWKMAELEHTARFSLNSVVFARMFLAGAVDTAGLLAVILAVRPMLPYSLAQVFLYMMVPFLAASLAGSVYERKRRPDNDWGSIVICLLSSVFFAAAPYLYSSLSEKRLTIVWAAAFILIACSLGAGIRRWSNEMKTEEPVWN